MSISRHRLTLSLEVKRVAGQAPALPLSASFDEAGGSIGRREDNDWVLPDPERFISGRHALISFSDGQFLVTDISSNGVYLNQVETPIGDGGSAALQQGDTLTIGEYEIGVSLRESDVQTVDAASFDALDDPFARLLEEHAGHRLEEPPYPSLDSNQEGATGGAVFTLEESAPLDLDDDSPNIPGPSMPVVSESDHISDLDTHFSQPGLIPEDWEEENKGSVEVEVADDFYNGSSLLDTPSDQLHRSSGVGQEVEESIQGFLDEPPSSRRKAEPVSTDLALMRRALADGLGISPNLLDELPLQAVLENLGHVVRCSVDGVMAVLRARAQMKSEFRMSQTMIRPVENNPLKFSVNTEEALRHIITSQASSGYLSPLAAFREAHEDIEAHMLAVMVGMQSALKAMLQRFKPENLEQRLGQSALLEKVPLYRQAKSWELFNECYSEIANEAEDDFQQLFGRAFSQAYEAQIRRLASLKNSNENTTQNRY
jgi:type VI secretion system protein